MTMVMAEILDKLYLNSIRITVKISVIKRSDYLVASTECGKM